MDWNCSSKFDFRISILNWFLQCILSRRYCFFLYFSAIFKKTIGHETRVRHSHSAADTGCNCIRLTIMNLIYYNAFKDLTIYFLDECIHIALDGLQFHHSRKVRCPQRSTRAKHCVTDYFHHVQCAILVADDHSRVVILSLEFIRLQDDLLKSHLETDCDFRAETDFFLIVIGLI